MLTTELHDNVNATRESIIDIEKNYDHYPCEENRDWMGIDHKSEQIRYHEMRPGYYTIIKNIYVLRGAKFIAEFLSI